MAPHDIDALSRSIKTLNRRLHQLADEDELIELLRIIRNPGWTTPAEFKLVSSIVRSLDVQARAMTQLKTDLLDGSRQVGVRQVKKAA